MTTQNMANSLRSSAQDGQFLAQTTTERTHVKERHVIPVSGLVDRLISSDESAGISTSVGTFTDEKSMQKAIDWLIYENADDIAVDLAFMAENPGKRRSLAVEDRVPGIPPQPGLKLDSVSGHIWSYESDTIRLVIQPSDATDLQIETITAYPCCKRPSQTQKFDVLPHMRKSRTYTKASPLGKAGLELLCDEQSQTKVKLHEPDVDIDLPFDGEHNQRLSLAPDTNNTVSAILLQWKPLEANRIAATILEVGSERWRDLEIAYPDIMFDANRIITRFDELTHPVYVEEPVDTVEFGSDEHDKDFLF